MGARLMSYSNLAVAWGVTVDLAPIACVYNVAHLNVVFHSRD